VVVSPGRATALDARSASRVRLGGGADVAAETHVRYLDAPVRRVLSIIPSKYDDIWTGAKGFYKVEPVVADGGEVDPLRAAHHRDLADAPGDQRDRLPLPRLLREAVGPLPGRALGRAGALHPPAREPARTTRPRGRSASGHRHLATGIPEDRVRRANLDYLDPAEVDPGEWATDPDTMVVPHAARTVPTARRGLGPP
jgi:hypothetical protein